MVKFYQYTVSGSAANGQSWIINGNVDCDLLQLHSKVMKDTFVKLTKGQAIFGRPGLGCEGPYDIHRILIEQIIH